jgi:hypothetical protein
LCQRRHLSYPGSGPSTPEVKPLLPAYFLLASQWLQRSSSFSSRGGRRRRIRSPRLRAHTPLYRQGSGYKLGGRLPGCRLLAAASSAWSSGPPLSSFDSALYKATFPPLDRHLGGICPPFCLGSFRGEGSCSLVGGVRSWRASLPSFSSVDLVGARPLSATQPLEESYPHCPALALLGGVASRLLAQPAL